MKVNYLASEKVKMDVADRRESKSSRTRKGSVKLGAGEGGELSQQPRGRGGKWDVKRCESCCGHRWLKAGCTASPWCH